MDGCDRQSRQGWPDRRRPPELEYASATHDHPLPAWVKRSIVGLGVAVLLSVLAVALLLYYVFGRTQYRDQVTQRQDEQFRQGMCELLDQLPEDVLLDKLRDKYGCSPGIPLRDMPGIYGDQPEDLTNVPIPND